MAIFNQVVSGGGGSSVSEPYLEFDVDANGKLIRKQTSRMVDLTGVKDVTISYVFNELYKGNTYISGIADLHTIEKVTYPDACAYMFYNTSISGFDLSSLTLVSGQDGCRAIFAYCQNITNAVIPELTTVNGRYACDGFFTSCRNLVTASIPKLEVIQAQSAMSSLFSGATSLETFRFESLNYIGAAYVIQQAFNGCTSLQSVWFYALNTNSFGTYTNQFALMLQGCSGVTVHFPMAIQSTIGSWSDVTGGFGGTNTTVLFDLVTSLTGADSNTYTRSEKNSTSTATAWLYNDTLYYTSGVSNHTAGVNEPSVGDTIYSDAACQTAVTTISSIA